MEMSAPVQFFVPLLQTVIHGMSLLIMPQDAEIVTSFCACSSTVFPGGIFFLLTEIRTGRCCRALCLSLSGEWR